MHPLDLVAVPVLLPIDEQAAIRLAAAVCEVAARDAKRGNVAAAAWLAELRAVRPRSLRILGAGG